jgi:hypothetical protein
LAALHERNKYAYMAKIPWPATDQACEHGQVGFDFDIVFFKLAIVSSFSCYGIFFSTDICIIHVNNTALSIDGAFAQETQG